MTKSDKLISLVLEYQKTKNNNILDQIIELNKRLITWYLENTELNITKNELYNIIIKGITISSLNYNKDKNDNIIRYLATGIRNTIDCELNLRVRSKKVLFETFLDYKRLIESKYKVTLEKDFSIFDDIIDLMCEDKLFKESDKLEVKKRILKILKTYHGNLILTSFNPISLYDINNLDSIMKKNLSSFEYDILCSNFGLFNNPKLSLEEISKKYEMGITTIKVYKNVALKKLKSYFDYYFKKEQVNINKVKEFLNIILTKEEYNYFVLNNGLFENTELNQVSISEKENVTNFYVSIVINNALTKISFALNNYHKVVPNLKLIKPYLESILSSIEFNVFASSYGLFGYPKLKIDEICQEYNIDNQNRIYELNRNIKEKIKDTIYETFNKDEIEKFLKNIVPNF